MPAAPHPRATRHTPSVRQTAEPPCPEHAPHCPEKSAKDGINWVPTLSVEMKLDSVGARLRAGPRRPSFWRGRGVWPTRTPVRVERRGEGGGGGSGRESS